MVADLSDIFGFGRVRGIRYEGKGERPLLLLVQLRSKECRRTWSLGEDVKFEGVLAVVLLYCSVTCLLNV